MVHLHYGIIDSSFARVTLDTFQNKCYVSTSNFVRINKTFVSKIFVKSMCSIDLEKKLKDGIFNNNKKVKIEKFRNFKKIIKLKNENNNKKV